MSIVGLNALPRWAGASVIALGSLALAGWLFDLGALKTLYPGWVSMKANTAVCFILAGSALSLQLPQRISRRRLVTARCLAITVILIGFCTLIEYLSGKSFGLDQVLFSESAHEAGVSFPGRMSPASAIDFVLLGAALATLDVRTRRNGLWPAQLAALTAMVVTLLAFVGYFYGVEALRRVAPYSSIALHTVVGFWLLCLGILFARPEQGVMAVFTSESSGGILDRRMLPAVIFLPLLGGWLCVLGERSGLYGVGLGAALLAMVMVGSFSFLVIGAAAALNHAEIERRRALEAIQESEKREHARVMELEAFMEGAPVVVWLALDPECRRITGNRAALEMLKMPTATNVSKTATAPERPNHFQVYREGQPVADEDLPIQKAAREGKPILAQKLELRFVDGTTRWIYGNVVPLFRPDGTVRGALAAFIDITALNTAEQQLNSSREQLRTLAARLQAVREEERSQLAREIHDVLAQELTRIKMDIAWLERRLTQPLDEKRQTLLREKLHAMSEVADTAITSVQRIATELRPVVLDSLGLCAAIEWQAKDFEARTAIACRASVPESDLQLDRDSATALFRILQESLTNVARHAQAHRVEVELHAADGWVHLRIRDDGLSINAFQLNDPRSVGLLGMRERAALLGGHCSIGAHPHGGTQVSARLPLAPRSQTNLHPHENPAR